MGLAGELMKSVFNKGRTDRNGRCGFRFRERRKWGRVRSSLCGDEFGLVPAEVDTTSLQPLSRESFNEEETCVAEENIPREKPNSISKLFREQDAAVVIQTAFRSFLARNQRKEEMVNEEDNRHLLLPIGRDWSPNVESVGTSLEVLSAYSVQLLSETAGTESPAREPSGRESIGTPSEKVQGVTLQQQDSSMVNQPKQKPRISVLRAKWDDSTVSSNVVEMRIKRRLEGMTRRERALAYAFSQQLRFCSRKRPEGEEADAAGMSEQSPADKSAEKPGESCLIWPGKKRRAVDRTRMLNSESENSGNWECSPTRRQPKIVGTNGTDVKKQRHSVQNCSSLRSLAALYHVEPPVTLAGDHCEGTKPWRIWDETRLHNKKDFGPRVSASNY
ncbi:hypothetical protein MLD38_003023 [Melastoma candidum]|uniref:Uncharacterized protein n=1 Tax=Melastoma candidum TaxID=119954 RepID=A0ACB9S1G9_9MYRT|nr:hypothetical protein MLD38_003023 [Melastoma candidum]